ncbi:L-ascorbate peroxidase 3, peroxisomal [Galdieria sulphuraria]|nr:L-ascorbate peroxidase 3, peroxisomal [Galdieria sulphuraria]
MSQILIFEKRKMGYSDQVFAKSTTFMGRTYLSCRSCPTSSWSKQDGAPGHKMRGGPYMVASKTDLEQRVRTRLIKLFEQTPCMPIMVRLAWHDAGTYDAQTGTGGVNGSIRFEPELKHGANNGLKIAFDLLEPIKKEYPDIGYADLFQLASVTAIEFAKGPKIPFRMGRKDATGPDSCPEEGRLPNAEDHLSQLRRTFHRMGLTDKDITVLSGAHTLGRCHKERSGYEGPWTHQPLEFDNSYFVEILKPDPDPGLLRLASDLSLLEDSYTRNLVETYAANKDIFFKDYTESHHKLSELGAVWEY